MCFLPNKSIERMYNTTRRSQWNDNGDSFMIIIMFISEDDLKIIKFLSTISAIV